MLGGASTERLPLAEERRASLGIPFLVISHSSTPGNASADAMCHDEAAKPRWLICLDLETKDTRGEARAIGRLVNAQGWTDITVVTSRYHVARAGTLIRQCTHAQVDTVGSTPDFNPKQWLDRFVIESGGLLDVILRPECVGEANADRQ
ncbi:YdcF family protein [Pseudarthrobacter enclensis]|uniref:DUF218 domain-containing protein n=1 Tax=Pseudarthrobacter enclensis TaxID=993070 RepID=A0A0V8IVE1_9MICC|nr:ElyC/SanA/YdcF family protein [Pseudarthrobacter enclensis]KSU78684.1 hypothetical protein AS031_01110 [Pseudarthrobacter enclensis]